VTFAWFAATILALKFAGPGMALIASLAVGGAMGGYGAYTMIPGALGTLRLESTITLAVQMFVAFCFFGSIIWGIVLLTDAAIAFLSRGLNRPDRQR
jgi:hypothetical protein